jgi:L-ascorbate metabolism protein UlaG (beta-lactamase superfamily)
MNINKAVKALDRIKPRVAIPMHFNTFRGIRADPQQFKRKAEAAGHLVTIIPIGESITVNARGE